MADFDRGLRSYDRPEILYRLFFPRRDLTPDSRDSGVLNRFVEVSEGISVCCRFYPAGKDGPNILYFHGNGEVASDYDYVAPVYAQRGLNLFVADYRGYGGSGGNPTCTAMIKDAHPIFRDFMRCIEEDGLTGDPFVMGRSLGSAPAIELAYHYQDELRGLIVESGFASARNQVARLGVEYLFGDEDPVGFGNDLKIKDVKVPTLIIHGEWDEIIPSSEGRALYDLSGAADRSCLFIPRAGHNDIMMLGSTAYMDAVNAFTDRA
ncbi:MAG: alpha/beta hydrolase [Syntrophorhabdaceae bacterium]|nr:alpha/beta hydrolase [Syntrophorhabdaceae bacterium]